MRLNLLLVASFLFAFVVLAFHVDARQASPRRMCCRAMTADCIACSRGTTVEELCKENPEKYYCRTNKDHVIEEEDDDDEEEDDDKNEGEEDDDKNEGEEDDARKGFKNNDYKDTKKKKWPNHKEIENF